jgi:hypothetical protein
MLFCVSEKKWFTLVLMKVYFDFYEMAAKGVGL